MVSVLQAALAACALLVSCAWGQGTWPAKPVTILTGYQPGSGTDTVARFIAEQLRKRTNQPFIVEYRPGAIGNVAAQAVARAAPDGYTVLFTPNSTHAINPSLFKQLPYDPIKDFQPVTTVLSVGFVLVVNPGTVPVSSVAELNSYVRANPGKVSSGSGNASVEVAASMYRKLAGLDAVNVRYKGVPQSINDLLGGQIHFAFTDVTFGLPHMRAGKIRPLAVTTAKRISFLPDVPTMVEAGVTGFEDITGWMGFFLPANVPMDIARRFAEHCNAIMASEDGRALLERMGAELFPSSPERTASFIQSELAKWSKIVRAAGIEPE